MKAIYLSAIVSTVAAMSSSAVIIDNFESGGASVTLGSGTTSGIYQRTAQDSGLSGTDTIGGNREVTAHRTDNNGNLLSSAVTGGAFTFQTGVTTGHGHLWYDGADGIPATTANTAPPIDFDGFNSVDLSASGENNFHFQAVSDLASSIILEIYKNGATETGKATATINLVGDSVAYSNGAFTDYYIPFSAFTASGGWDNLTDFTDVGAIKVTIDTAVPSAAVDFDNFETVLVSVPVPEFHHYAMFAGLGCLGFAMVRNRLMKKVS